jgi:hypothetical protein
MVNEERAIREGGFRLSVDDAEFCKAQRKRSPEAQKNWMINPMIRCPLF